MSRKPTLAEHTNEEAHLRFKAAVAQLGQSVDAREGQMHALLIDGVRLGGKRCFKAVLTAIKLAS
jgi:hypothetical protein